MKVLLILALGWLLVFELYACESTPIEEQAIFCKPVESDECVTLRKKADRLAAIKDRRVRGTCPPSYVRYRDHRGERCVSEREVNRMLGDW
tara:strand:+ start:4119 stop:4391 length:273 start_codon:yes stop_codon:yes gene_type:complete